MWWEYLIIGIAILSSFVYLIRNIKKKVEKPTCNCDECPLIKKDEGDHQSLSSGCTADCVNNSQN